MIAVRNNKTQRIIAGALAGTVALTTLTFTIVTNTKASAFDGDFESGTFDTWDGSSYDFSWYDTNAETYTISSAAQLAALSILTNDLSGDDWAPLVAALPDNCDAYLSTCDNFEGKEIRLNTDIDLNDKDWLPISYIFNTPYITYDLYPALEHVPTDLTAVDSWVGDKDGNPINTRYLELKASEMRYRDLVYLYGSDRKTNERITRDKELTSGIGIMYYGTAGYCTYDADSSIPVHRYFYDRLYNTFDSTYKVSTLKEVQATEIPISYVYSDISKHTNGGKFNGTFNGNNKRIKGLRPDTPWDATTRVIPDTFDPLGKGLFSYIDTDAVIKDLNVKGTYDDEVVSYSAFLCAYNYGTISNCYVYGQMKQGLVTSPYPTYRDYGEDGTSVYEYETGTVLPVGNSGFVTAWNAGEIDGCTTAGEVTQAFRQFGFITCTNEGTIKNCLNKASASNTNVTTDFITDEWSYTYSPDSDLLELAHSIDTPEYFSTKHYQLHQSTPSKVSWWDTNAPDALRQYDDKYTTAAQWPGLSSTGEISVAKNLLYGTNAVLQGLTGNAAFVPYLYKTEVGESLAANHIYGTYWLTAIGGICVVNNGLVENCTNEGSIQALGNCSTRQFGNMYSDTDNPTARDRTSYIRPTTAFGIFSTQLNSFNFATGIAVYNFGILRNVKNTANMLTRDWTEGEKGYEFEGITYDGYLINGTQIVFAPNGMHMNDTYIYDTYASQADYVYNPLGTRWWLTDDLKDIDAFSYSKDYYTDANMVGALVEGGTAAWLISPVEPDESGRVLIDHFDVKLLDKIDNTMPYPAACANLNSVSYIPEYKHLDSRKLVEYGIITNSLWHAQLTAGVSMFNTNNIDGATNTGLAMYGILYMSKSFGEESITMSDIVQTSESPVSVGEFFYDTNLTNVEIVDLTAPNAIGSTMSNKLPVSVQNVRVLQGHGAFNTISGTAEARTRFDKYYNYDKTSNGGLGRLRSLYVDYNDIVSLGSLIVTPESTLCSLNNIYLYGDTTNFIKGSLVGSNSNWNYFGSTGININVGKSHADTDNMTVSDIRVYITTDGSTLADCEPSMSFYSVDKVSDIDLVTGETNKYLFEASTSTLENVNVYADTQSRISDNTAYVNINNSTVKDAIFQIQANITWTDIETSGRAQALPQMLKAEYDTNTFDTVAVQLPYGCLSYSTFNYMLDDDTSIKTDAQLVYDTNARASGALAYYLDHGDTPDRQYRYTVAEPETVNIVDELPEDFWTYNDFTVSPSDFKFTEVTLPKRTRLKKDPSEDSYYRVTIPYNGAGMGEVIGSMSRDGITYSTLALNQRFPVTDLFVKQSETVSLSPSIVKGYGLYKTTLNYADGASVEVDWGESERIDVVTRNTDLTVDTEWKHTYAVSTVSTPYVSVKANCKLAMPGTDIYVTPTLLSTDYDIKKLYYYNYYKSSDNLWILDPTPIEINLDTAIFTMPTNPVEVHADLVKNNAEISRFVLEGVDGIIDNNARTIDVFIEAPVDLSSLKVQTIETDAVAVNPSTDTYVNFLEPVIYTIECENGRLIDYVVTAHSDLEGTIYYYNWLGYPGIIDQETGEILLNIPDTVTLSGDALIKWFGTNLATHIEVSDTEHYSYTVYTNAGTKEYNLIVETYTSDTPLDYLAVALADGTKADFSIDHTNKVATLNVPYGTDLSRVYLLDVRGNGVPVVSTGSSLLNLTKRLFITITDSMGHTETYRLVGKVIPSSTKVLNQFVLFGVQGIIDEEAKKVTVTLPKQYDVRNVRPDVVSFTGSSLNGAYDIHDFTQPVEYVVKAYDGTEVTYEVITERSAD